MRPTRIAASVLWGRGDEPNRSHRISIFLVIFLLALAVSPAWGGLYSPGRMVYANGQIHRIWIDQNYGHILHQAGLPADQVNGTGNFLALYAADQGPYICRYHTLASNEGVAVFNNKIFVVYTKDSSCGNSGSMSSYVAVFDMTGTDQYPHGRWIVSDHRLGAVGYNSVSAAAITVFKGKLYAFTDTDTYTSGDGVGWSPHSHPIVTGNRQPLDAVTIYPHNAEPQILIVYSGPSCSGCNYFAYVYAATWSGDFGASRRDYAGSCSRAPSGCLAGNPIVGSGTSHPNFDGRASLLPGTKSASASSGSVGGDTVPAVQFFVQSLNINNSNRWIRNLEYHIDDGNWYKKDIDYTCSGTMIYPWYVAQCDSAHKSAQARKQRFVALGCGSSIPSFDSDFLVPMNKEAISACGTANGTLTTASPDNPVTRNYLSLIGVILGSAPFSVNRTSTVTDVKPISSVVYGTTAEGTTTHTQQWNNQNLLSVGAEVSAGLSIFEGDVKVKDTFDVTYKHDWESTHENKSSQSVVVVSTMGTDTYADGVFEPVPFSACTVDADCSQYADANAGEFDSTSERYPACRIYDTTQTTWRNCGSGDATCVCTVTSTGKHGWALFNAPNLYVQDNAVYAYDYNYHTGAGTDLNQALHTVEAKGFSVVPVTFDLKHPELTSRLMDQDGTVRGLLEGMQPFPYSTDLLAWNAQQSWGRTDLPWWIKLGPGSDPNLGTITHDKSANLGVTYTETTADVKSSGETKSTEIRNTTSVEVGLGMMGFGSSLTVGRDSSFSTSISAESSFEKNVQAIFAMPQCTIGMHGCIWKVTTQPYLLVATGKAPWVPDRYPVLTGKNGPWCMTWTVTNWCPGGPECTTGSSTSIVSALSSPFNISAEGLPPAFASGRIVGGTGGGELGPDLYSHYSLQGGRLAWVDNTGTEMRIPMTADEFDPSKGATIEINGRGWSAAGNGRWTRSGSIWTFETDPKAKENRVSLALDFGSANYDLQIQKVNLEGYTFAGMTDVVLRLGVNGVYTFSSTIHHDVDISWRLNKPPADSLKMYVTSFEGRYNSATQSGKMSLSGTLPADLPEFGDVGVVINGQQRDVPLISTDSFIHTFQTGGVVKYTNQGLILMIDFGGKTWSATFNNQAFDRLLVPRWGQIKAKIIVGGVPVIDRENAVVDFSANLTLKR